MSDELEFTCIEDYMDYFMKKNSRDVQFVNGISVDEVVRLAIGDAKCLVQIIQVLKDDEFDDMKYFKAKTAATYNKRHDYILWFCEMFNGSEYKEELEKYDAIIRGEYQEEEEDV